MEAAQTGQVNTAAAEIYEDFFVPALFAQWPEQLLTRARIEPGQRVLDVACGTGVLTRSLARSVAPGGEAVGLDVNPGMLAVAARQAPNLQWVQGRVEDLPFEEGSFDAVFCQFGLMFFEDRTRAILEMLRVLAPGKRLVVAVWDLLDTSPGYASVVELLERLFGTEPADALRAPFCLGDEATLLDVFARAGVSAPKLETLAGSARFASLDAWMYTDVKGWTLADLIDDEQFEQLRREARPALREFEQPDGSVQFAAPAHVVVVEKPQP